ncbi:hypothetical protein MESS4_440008 [Mesorhizobium sp. STM 4661]|nr:hypothetical protein MESS4_440008 [Mesorhizobium sp. STM 4661]
MVIGATCFLSEHVVVPKPLRTFGRYASSLEHVFIPKPLHTFGRHARDYAAAGDGSPLPLEQDTMTD